MESHELLPPRAVITVNDQELELGEFSLYEKGWALQEFRTKENPNGLEVLTAGLRALDKLVIARFAWRLVKKVPPITKKEFFAFCEDTQNVIQVLEAINATVSNGEPNKHFAKKLDELKK
jgi:hypothetical protein